MQRSNFIMIAVVALFNLSGCVPFPTKNIDTPKIEGSLHSGTSELGQYLIYVAYDVSDACSSYDLGDAVETVSDARGNFVLEPTYEWSAVRWAVPLDGLVYLSICIVAPDGIKKWAYLSHMRTPSWAPDIKMTCEYDELLSEPVKIDHTEMYELNKGCKRAQS